MSGRVQSTTTGGGLEIRIKPESIGLNVIFPLAFLAFMTWCEFFAIKQVIKMITMGAKDLDAVVLICFWLFFWTCGEVMLILVMLYHFAGEEIISLKDGILQIKISLLGLGRSRQFQSMHIQNLRMTNLELRRSRPFALKPGSGGAICFDYEGVTYRFGMLTEVEARQVIDQMAMFLPNAVQLHAEQKV
jgi:hypothetical protein